MAKARPRRQSGAPGAGAGAYHHGDLRRQTLLEAGRLLREEGASGVSVRRIASNVGVSPMALYNHFDDRQEILIALAEAGFSALRSSILRAAPPKRPPLERLRQGAVAYVLFATEHRREFELMFGGVGVDLAQEPRLHAAAESAFEPLVTCLRECSEAGLLRADPIVAERLIWSAAHGYASLWNSVPELMRGGRSHIRRNAESMLDAILQGLEAVAEAHPKSTRRANQ